MSVKDCFGQGMLRKCPIEKERVQACISLSEHYLSRAEGNIKLDFYDVAFLMAYNSMFQAGRAFLFSQGVKERSHYCLVAYLREALKEDAKLSKFVEILDVYRQNRHMTQYEGESVSESEAKQAISDARAFLKEVTPKVKKSPQA